MVPRQYCSRGIAEKFLRNARRRCLIRCTVSGYSKTSSFTLSLCSAPFEDVSEDVFGEVSEDVAEDIFEDVFDEVSGEVFDDASCEVSEDESGASDSGLFAEDAWDAETDS